MSETIRTEPSIRRIVRVVRLLVLLVAPIGAATAMSIHPHAGNDAYATLSPVVDAWVGAHLLLFVSLALIAWGLYLLSAKVHGTPATIARLGIGVFAVLYLGYVAVVGLTSGLLIRESQALSSEQQAGVAAVVEYLLTEPLLFYVGAAGAVGFLVATSGLAVAYRRIGTSTLPGILLVGSVSALVAHSGAFAIAGMGLFLIGSLWLEFESRSAEDADRPPTSRSEPDPNAHSESET